MGAVAAGLRRPCDHAAAIALALPNPRRWREAFRVRRYVVGHKRVFDLHRAGGMWLLPVTPCPDERAPDLPRPLDSPPVSFGQAIAAVPGAKVDGVAYNPAKGLYWLRAFDDRDIDPYGRRWIYVDGRNRGSFPTRMPPPVRRATDAGSRRRRMTA